MKDFSSYYLNVAQVTGTIFLQGTIIIRFIKVKISHATVKKGKVKVTCPTAAAIPKSYLIRQNIDKVMIKQ